ncbi:MAG: error-prone DNA polymerase [Alphaproteobacteria bacterium]
MTAYAELQVTTNFTFLRGASHAHELVETAAALGLAAIAVTDRNTLAGAVRMHTAAKAAGIRLVVGARLDFTCGNAVLAYPTDKSAYARLSRLITLGRRRAPKGECHLTPTDLAEHGEGLEIVLLLPEAVDAAWRDHAAGLARAFGRRCHLAAQAHMTGRDAGRLARMAALADALDVPLVATNDVLYHRPERKALADALTCIREKCTVDDAGWRLEANAERYLKAGEAMADLFARYPEALANACALAGRCRFSLDELRYEYPHEVMAGHPTPQAALEALTAQGAAWRFPRGVPDKVRAQLDHELALIGQLNYAAYFLTVYDIVRFAREQNILCQGRGSAANSAVCYCLGITAVDPTAVDLLFERFISAARNEPPDIDVDFEHERREEVIQYIYAKYGRHRAGLTATVISYRARSAVREIGKAMGLSEDAVSALAGQIWGWSSEGVEEERVREAGLDPGAPRVAMTLELTGQLIGFPRHLSQHVGGFIIARDRLDDIVPIENAAMDDRTVVEWDKDDIDALGILKVDVLALGMLTCLRKGFALLADHHGVAIPDIAAVPTEDPRVYDMLCAGDSIGVFQVESRAQMNFLPRMKPRTFYDLVIEVAIIRPGPIQGDMVHPYLRRRNGEETVTYPSAALEAVLGKTLGVPLFQEQAMKIAIVGAGFTPEEADQLRRAMATFRKTGTIHHFYRKMTEGMIANGYDADFAERCFRQIEGFGEYGFPESHAASFALLAYVSSWLKCYYPAAFACALLNSQPMGFYAPAQIVRDAANHGVEVLPADVNMSRWDYTLEHGAGGAMALRIGLRQIKGLREDEVERLVAVRGNGYPDPAALWRRAALQPRSLAILARADACRSMGLSRRQALWAVRGLGQAREAPLPLFAHAEAPERGAEPATPLPEMPLGEEVVEDYTALRMTLRDHPLKLLRGEMAAAGVTPNAELLHVDDGRWVTVAGLVLVRQRPGTASGVIFITIEDETGWANVIVWPDAFTRYRKTVMRSRLLLVRGRMQREDSVIHIISSRLEDLSPSLDRLSELRAPVPVPLDRADEVRRPNPADPRGGRAGRPAARLAPTGAGDGTPAIPRATPRPAHPRDQARLLFPSRDFH